MYITYRTYTCSYAVCSQRSFFDEIIHRFCFENEKKNQNYIDIKLNSLFIKVFTMVQIHSTHIKHCSKPDLMPLFCRNFIIKNE